MYNGVVHQGKLPAPWNEYAKDEEKQLLATIERRLKLKKATTDELLAERQAIMRRCIRRKRRAEGKE